MELRSRPVIFSALSAVWLLVAIAPDLKRDIGFADAAVTACPCRYCGDATYCHNMGHNIVPIGLPDRNVKRVLLYGNNITAIYGGDFRGMVHLEMLVLNNNMIRSVDADAFEGLIKLHSLHLEYNQITHISEGTLRNLPRIKNLYLDHNNLATFPGDIPYLHRLEKLTLADNSITSIYWASFIQLDQIKSLTLWKNPLRCNCNTQEMKRWFKSTSSGRAINDKSNASWCPQANNCTSPKILSIEHIRNDGAFPENVYITNERAMLHCNVTGSPAPLVVWQTKTAGFVFPFKTGRIEAFPNGTLVVSKLAKTDMGTYVCHAQRSGRGGSDTTMKTLLFVTDGVKPQAIPKKVKFERQVDGKVDLVCDVTGVPKPAILWQHLEGGVWFDAENVTGKRFKLSREDTRAKLVIEKLTVEDGGQWRCIARNNQGSAFGSIDLVVQAPKITDITVIIIGACAGAVFLVIVAVVTAIACIIKRRRGHSDLKKGRDRKIQSSPHETDSSELEWTQEKGQKGTGKREKREKGDEQNKEKGESIIRERQDKSETNTDKLGKNNPAFSQSELPQPYEHEPEVKGFRL